MRLLAKRHRQPYVYVLACENNCYYIGFSRNLHRRLQNHFRGTGAFFTKANRPLRLISFTPARSEHDEFRIWTEYAIRHGFHRVGGYSPWLCRKCGFKWPFPPVDISILDL